MRNRKSQRQSATDELKEFVENERREEESVGEPPILNGRVFAQKGTHDRRYDCVCKRQRAEAALSRLQRGTHDSQPILITVDSTFGMTLSLYVFDMGGDLAGLRVREVRNSQNGAVELDEDYPVFSWDQRYQPQRPLLARIGFGMVVRDKGQRKDEHRWQEWAALAREELAAVLREGRATTAKTIPPMPPIWMSFPKPDQVRIFLSIYDTMGNESERVELREWATPEDLGDTGDNHEWRFLKG